MLKSYPHQIVNHNLNPHIHPAVVTREQYVAQREDYRLKQYTHAKPSHERIITKNSSVSSSFITHGADHMSARASGVAMSMTISV